MILLEAVDVKLIVAPQKANSTTVGNYRRALRYELILTSKTTYTGYNRNGTSQRRKVRKIEDYLTPSSFKM